MRKAPPTAPPGGGVGNLTTIKTEGVALTPDLLDTGAGPAEEQDAPARDDVNMRHTAQAP